MQVVHKDALHPQDFEEVSGKVRIKRQLQTYSLNFTQYAESRENHRVVGESKCRIKNGLGIIHLEFTRIGDDFKIAELPSDCPTPLDTIIVFFPDRHHVVIYGGSRDILSDGEINRQYVVDLVGFFNED